MTRIAKFETRKDGYERWRSWNSEDGDRYCYVHQLLAIAHGGDPRAIFSDGQIHVHHRDSIKWDNRNENIELKDRGEHTREHNKKRGKVIKTVEGRQGGY